MNLKNKATGRIVSVPPGEPKDEPEVFVSLTGGELRERTGYNANLLTSEEYVRRTEERWREERAQRELWRSRMFGLLWAVVGILIWVGILAYCAEAFTNGMRNFLRGN